MDPAAVTIQSFHETAPAYESRFMDCSGYAQDLSAFCGLLAPGARILDLGCGPGNVARFVLDARPDVKVLGVDAASAMLERFRKNVPEAEARTCDLRDVAGLCGSFDAALASFCLPFLGQDEAAELLRAVGRLVVPQGVLYLSTMQGRGGGFERTSFGGERDFYFNYFERTFLDDTLATAGFEVLSYREQLYRQPPAQDLIDMIYLGRRTAPRCL